MIVFGVPVLSRYDLLERLLVSAEAGTAKPDLYLVVDNGGAFEPENSAAMGLAIARGARLEVLRVGRNLGVAASWNRILDRALPYAAIISNDDIVLGSESIELLTRCVEEHPFVIAEGGSDASGWCLFAQAPSLLAIVGHYDENFFPAYYEDSDYRRRMVRTGFCPYLVHSSHSHYVRGTLQKEVAGGPIHQGRRKGLEYFERKWGGHPDSEVFSDPFDGAPIDWKIRNLEGTWIDFFDRPLKRWDVIDYVAEAAGRSRYLEIGVSTGEVMKRAAFKVKIGVDPEPTIDAVRASTVFYPIQSDEYFSAHSSGSFNVTFIDGLHLADQAYRDIENACACSKIVVVHDANPSTEEMQRVPYAGGDWTGDVWKAVARIRAEGIHTVRTIDADFGIAVVFPNRPEKVPQMPRDTWSDLVQHRVELLGLLSESDWKTEIDRLLDPGQSA